MKKKLLLLTVLVMAFVCLFAVIASAAEYKQNDKGIWYSTSDEFAPAEYVNYFVTAKSGTVGTTEVTTSTAGNSGKEGILQLLVSEYYDDTITSDFVVLANGDGTYSTYPTVYIVDVDHDQSERWKGMSPSRLNDLTGYTYSAYDTAENSSVAASEIVRIMIPENVKYFHKDTRYESTSFMGSTVLKEIIFPSTFTNKDISPIGGLFQNCTNLTKVDFSQSSYVKLGSNWFDGCTALTEDGLVFAEKTQLHIGGSYVFNGATQLDKDIFAKLNVISISDSAFRGSCFINIDFSNSTFTQFNENTFNAQKSLKTIKLPTTLQKFHKGNTFRDCTALEFVDFGNNTNAVSIDIHCTFYNCSSLQAISLPANTTIISNGTFAKCTSLKAVYLGEALTQINGNKGDGSGDAPTFCDCTNMYFVNEPFSVTKEDGSFYTKEEFKQPNKPSVYYFPSTLVRILGSHNVPNSIVINEDGMVQTSGGYDDRTFVNCKKLNEYLVFPESYKGVDDNKTVNGTETTIVGDTLGTGLFHNCATESNPITLVFLGKIDRLSFDRRSGMTSYMTYMFANEANTSFENTKIGTYIGNSYYSNQNEMYVIFCNAEGGTQKYKINFVASESDKNVPVLEPTLIDKVDSDGDEIVDEWHVIDIRNDDEIVPATCINDAHGVVYCFCGVKMGEKTIENTKTGIHICEDDDDCTTPSKKCTADENCTYFVEAKEHNLTHTLVYANGFDKVGVYNHYCSNENCVLKVLDTDADGIADSEIIDQESPAIITAKGWSTPEKVAYFGINAGYEIDSTLLAKYETLNNDKVTLGLFIVGVDSVKSVGAILDSNCEIVENVKGFKVSISSDGYSKISIELRGFEQGENNAGNYYTLNLISAMYVKTKDGIKYVQTSLSDDSTENRVVINEGTFNTISADRIYTSIANKQ